MTTARSPRAILLILDGFGIGKDSPFNAISNARMPFFKDLMKKYPHSELITHGEAVGLPAGVMGNSEVGHMTLGAGRIIYQDLTRISKEIREKNFFKNPALLAGIRTGARQSGRVHLMGLLSDAGVHSHIDHLFALLDLCAAEQVPHVSVHPFLDGRDTPPDSASTFIERLLRHPTFSPSSPTRAVIATLGGRYYGMDRDHRWDRVAKAYAAMTGQLPALGNPLKLSNGELALQAVQASHQNGKTDEFIEPMVLDPQAVMQNGDSVVFFNYRADRAREISRAITEKVFQDFDRGRAFLPSAYVGLTQYDRTLKEVVVAFAPQSQENIFGQWLEQRAFSQFRIAETEKYAHVTFFFNGGREQPFQGEERLLVPSPRDVETYDQKPEMSAYEVASQAVERIRQEKYNFMLMNFANADMVGHTGNYEAAIRALEALDKCLSQVIGAAQATDTDVLVTADHGNAEEMCDERGKPHTQHTLNPVPALWIAPNSAIAPKASRAPLLDGGLQDIMPTLCELMRLPLPAEVTGKSLLPK